VSARPTADAVPVDGTDELIRFVRETLGCGCPDEVLARIAIDSSEHGESGLDVGGRLLVRVLTEENTYRLVEAFPDTVERLRDERDRRGFRRVRLVVNRPQPDVLREVLETMLNVIVAADEHVYVHVIADEELPVGLSHPVS